MTGLTYFEELMNKLKNPYKSNFTVVGNGIINDKRLKPQERFLYIYLASKPDDWVFNNKIICSDLGIGENTFKRWSKSLVDLGWISKEQTMNDDGTFGANQYELFDLGAMGPEYHFNRTAKMVRHTKKDKPPTKERPLPRTSEETTVPAGPVVRETDIPAEHSVFYSVESMKDIILGFQQGYRKSIDSIEQMCMRLLRWRINNPSVVIENESNWVFSKLRESQDVLEYDPECVPFEESKYFPRWQAAITEYQIKFKL